MADSIPVARIPLEDRLEYTAGNERYFNYCLWEYAAQAPTEGKLQSASLLYHSFEHAGMDERAYDVVDRIRVALGISRTVWGVKLLGDQISWEYYFYDYRRRNRERSITKVLDAIRPVVTCPVVANETLHYFMFSLDMSREIVTGLHELDTVHMYIGNVGSTVSSGISYGLTTAGRQLENFYFFYKPAQQLEEIVGKVVCSAYIDPVGVDPGAILWPELTDCDTICVANKRFNDCVYFSGVNIDQFIFFLERLRYPQEIIAFVKENRRKLDHMLYDVGYDYTFGPDGLRILKSGYYGVF